MDERELSPSAHQDVQNQAALRMDVESPPTMKPLLRLAVQRGDIAYVSDYLDKGGDLDASDQRGRTALMIATSCGHTDLCSLIAGHIETRRQTQLSEARLQPAGVPANVERNAVEDSQFTPTNADDGLANDDEFKSEFFGAWSPETVESVPEDDVTVRSSVELLREAMANHVIIDRSQDWSDLAPQLPDPLDLGLARELTRDSTLCLFEGVFDRARDEGLFNQDELEDLAMEIGGDHDCLNHLVLAMGEIGAIAEDEIDWLRPIRRDYEAGSSIAEDDIRQFLQDLSAHTNDPTHQFLKLVGSSILLDRDGEERIGRLINSALYDAYRSIAVDSNCIPELVRLRDEVKNNEIAAGQITHLSAEYEGDASVAKLVDDSDMEDGQIKERRNDSLSALLEEAISACEQANAQGAEPRLRAQAHAAVAAIELTASTVKRFSRFLCQAGKENRSLRQAVARISLAEHQLFHSNLRLAIHVADKYSWSPMERMDRIQESMLGLLKAIDRFDFSKGTKFSTYAMWWLKQSVHRAMGDRARAIRLPVHMVERLSKLGKIVRSAGGDVLTDLPPRQLATSAGISVAEIEKLTRYSFDAVSWNECESIRGSVLLIRDGAPGPEQQADSDMRARAIRQCIDGLPAREAQIISHRFGLQDGLEKTLEEVGQIYGVTRERIRQIESKAMRLLRHPSRDLHRLINGSPAPQTAPTSERSA